MSILKFNACPSGSEPLRVIVMGVKANPDVVILKAVGALLITSIVTTNVESE